jgi:RNA polymerase sigma factor (sigma-70 family)
MSQASEVIQYLRRTVLPPDGAGMTDGQLLSRFIEGRDEDAFAALVRRHGPMVWGVCRRLLACHQDAEDAFQATFLVLVRKAASVRPREMVANWLYGVASMTARRANVAAAKARRRERRLAETPEPAVLEQDRWRDLQPLLDGELNRLPDKYRAVIVLCDLEGKTRTEAARQLGLPEGTVASRLARARALLAKRLARHGLAVSGGASALVLSQRAAPAGVPASVVSSTVKAASRFAAGQAAAVPAEVAALTAGVLKTMLLSRLRNAGVALLVVFSLMVGAAAVIPRTPAAEQPEKGKKVKDAEKALNEAQKALDEAKKALIEAKEKAGKEAVPPAPDKGEAKVKTRWEYKALSHDEIKALEFNRRGTDTTDGGLNMLGDEGWELVAIEPPVRGPVSPIGDRPALYVFKRPKQ